MTDGGGDAEASGFTVGGTVDGLGAGSVSLANKDGSSIIVSEDGPFGFPTPLPSGSSYEVTVLSQPTDPPQTCVVTNGVGVIGGEDVTNIGVTCVRLPRRVSVNVRGLATGSSVTLQNVRTATTATPEPESHTESSPALTADGVHRFSALVFPGQEYAVSVTAQPVYDAGRGQSQTCVVGENARGTVFEEDIEVSVTCTTNRFTVSGTVQGLVPHDGTRELTVRLVSPASFTTDPTYDLVLDQDGAFTFSDPKQRVLSGAEFTLSIEVSPSFPAQTCRFSGDSAAFTATMQNDDVTDVALHCDPPTCDQGGPCTVFVTSTARTPNFKGEHADGLAGADAICEAHAQAAGLPGTFMAWLSDSTRSPATRFTKAAGPYQRPDGVAIAASWADLTTRCPGNQGSACLLAPLNQTETGATVADGEQVATSTNTAGTLRHATNNCQLWTDDASSMGSHGVVGATNAEWTVRTNSLSCHLLYRLYCFQQPQPLDDALLQGSRPGAR